MTQTNIPLPFPSGMPLKSQFEGEYLILPRTTFSHIVFRAQDDTNEVHILESLRVTLSQGLIIHVVTYDTARRKVLCTPHASVDTIPPKGYDMLLGIPELLFLALFHSSKHIQS